MKKLLCIKSALYLSKDFPFNIHVRSQVDLVKHRHAFLEIFHVLVCYEVGFGSLSSFEKVFKKKFGVPPLQYRRAIKTEDLLIKTENLPSNSLEDMSK